MTYIPKYKPLHSGERALDKLLSTLLVYLEDAIRLDEQAQPRCPCCGETENLTSGWSCGKLIHLCPGAAREANHPGM